MEKGEKILPVCYRPEPAPKAREAKVEKSSSLRQEQWVLPSVSVERERPRPAQACTSPLSEAAAASEPVGKPPSPEAVGDTEGALFSEPVPVQVGALLQARGSFLPSDQGHLTWVGGPQMPPFSPSSAIPRRTSGFRSAGVSLSSATNTQAGDVFCEAVWCCDLFACSVVVSQMPTALPQLCEGRDGRDAGGSEQRTRGGRRQCGWDSDAGSTQGPGRLGCSIGEEGTRRRPEGRGGSGWDPKPLPGEQPCLFGDHGRLASGMMGRFSFPSKIGLGVQGGVLKKGLLSGNGGKGNERCERFTG